MQDTTKGSCIFFICSGYESNSACLSLKVKGGVRLRQMWVSARSSLANLPNKWPLLTAAGVAAAIAESFDDNDGGGADDDYNDEDDDGCKVLLSLLTPSKARVKQKDHLGYLQTWNKHFSCFNPILDIRHFGRCLKYGPALIKNIQCVTKKHFPVRFNEGT